MPAPAHPASFSEQNATTVTTTPHALLPFLASQSQNTLTRLYQRPSSCLSIFRSLFTLFLGRLCVLMLRNVDC